MKIEGISGEMVTPAGMAQSCAVNALPCPTKEAPPSENIGEFSGMSNREKVPPPGFFDREKPRKRFVQGDLRKVMDQIRLTRGRDLALSIRKTHPDDARVILTAALIDLMGGLPNCAVFGSIREDAEWWAGKATPVELMEVMLAALRRLKSRPMHKNERKRLLWAMWESLDPASQAAFLDRIGVQK